MSEYQKIMNEHVKIVRRGTKQVGVTWNGQPVSQTELRERTVKTPGLFAYIDAVKKRMTPSLGVRNAGIAKKTFKTPSIAKVADGLLGQAEEDEEDEVISGFLRAFPGLPDAFKKDFENQIKQISSRQAWSGSWLEYTGMRFAAPGVAVIDQERTQINNWTDPQFQAMINPTANLTIFLKSKFNLRELNNDTSIIEGSNPPTSWASIDGKGKMDVEPDVIVARRHPESGRIHIYIVELKIGNGKKEQKAAEHHQLMRLRHRIEMMCAAAGRPAPVIHLYFCAWQHGTKETNVGSIDFRRSRLGDFPYGTKYHVTVINSEHFEKITGVNSKFVNALLKKMDIVRLKLFYKTLKQFMSRRKGKYYPQMVSYANSLNQQLNAFKNQGAKVFTGPPVSVLGGASGSNQLAARQTSRVALGYKFGGREPKSFNNLSPKSLAAEIAHTQNRLGRLQASSARRMTEQQVVRTAHTQATPVANQLRRLEAINAAHASPTASNNSMGINFNR